MAGTHPERGGAHSLGLPEKVCACASECVSVCVCVCVLCVRMRVSVSVSVCEKVGARLEAILPTRPPTQQRNARVHLLVQP